MNIRIFPALVAAAGLLLASCLPESKNPLSTPANSSVDSRLGGVYVARREKKDGDLGCWHFHYRAISANGRVSTTPWLEVWDVEHEHNGGLNRNVYRALTTHIGTHDYMSFVDLGSGDDKGKTSLYSFARYEVNWSGDIRVWLINSEELAQAVKSGKVRGKVTSRKSGDDVLVTDSTEHLAAFVAASDPAKLFNGKPLVLYRLAR